DLKLWVPRGVRRIETGDFSGDGYPDFHLALEGMRDRLCRSVPAEAWQDWRFPDIAAEADLSDAAKPGVALFLDIDNDGWLDLVLGSSGGSAAEEEGAVLSLHHNQGGGTFAD